MGLYITTSRDISKRNSSHVFYFNYGGIFCLNNKVSQIIDKNPNDVDIILNYCKKHHIDGYEIVIDKYKNQNEIISLFDHLSKYLVDKDVSIGLLTTDDGFIRRHMDLIERFGISYPFSALYGKSHFKSASPKEKPVRKQSTDHKHFGLYYTLLPSDPEPESKKKTKEERIKPLIEQDSVSNIVLDESFNVRLIRLLRESGKDNVDVYKDGGISKQVFSNAISNKKIVPTKNTVICLAIGMELGYTDAMSLLEAAGYTLSKSIKFDVIIAKYFKRRIYDLFIINDELYENECPLLGWQPREDK